MVNENESSQLEETSESPAPADQEELLQRLENVEAVVSHPFFTTPFADYTVSEGLSLLILLVLLLCILIKCIKEAFSWL